MGWSSCSHRRWTQRVSLAGASEYKSGAKGAWEGGLIIRGPVLRGPRSPIPLLRERMPGRERPADNRSRNCGTPKGRHRLPGGKCRQIADGAEGKTMVESGSPTVQQSNSPTAQQPNSPTVQQSNSPTVQQPNSPTAQQPNSPTAQQPNSPTAQQPNSPTAQQPNSKPARYAK
jgi:hypothetical protein